MSLIQALQNPALYEHPIDKFEVIETHISWVLLTGEYVYKIKKPVDFGFLDFSTLEKRHHFCEEELRLNQRLAPKLYLEVVSITGSEEQPKINGPGEPIEYAVKMRQFPQSAQLDRLLAAGQLQPGIIDRLADKVAQFHQSIKSVEADSPYGDIDHLKLPMLENFTQIREAIDAADVKPTLDALEQWTRVHFLELAPAIAERKADGFVRECHGDMHLRNIALWQDEIVVFDCIEFNPNLYWIDVVSEIAFLIMDLEDREQEALAQRFLNRYLETTGDYYGLRLLPFYKVYRAMVRAKVDALRLKQEGEREQTGSSDYQQTFREFHQYLLLAERYIQPARPVLLINYGLSGSGKSVTTRQLAEALPAIQLRSDIERKRLFKVPPFGVASIDREVLYSAEAHDRTYARLEEIARGLLHAGYTVIVDAANLHRQRRQQFVELADSMHVPYLVLDFEAEEAILQQRIEERARTREDVSDATITVLQQQLADHEPISDDEQAYTIEIDTGGLIDINAIVEKIRNMTGPSIIKRGKEGSS
ncbi:MAG: bifunctional aminoglycoside phosphotransferase/ATP-binding protein [Acidiferrobacterales bacterium]